MTCFGRLAEPRRGGHWEVRLKGADLHTLMCLRTLAFTVGRRMAAQLFTIRILLQQRAAEDLLCALLQKKKKKIN